MLEVDEDEALPGVGRQRREPEPLPRDLVEVVLVEDAAELALEVVRPPVKAAAEVAAALAALLPYELVAPVGADVVERADDAIRAVDDEHRCPTDGDLPDEVRAGRGHVVDAADVQPYAAEDVLTLELRVLR